LLKPVNKTCNIAIHVYESRQVTELCDSKTLHKKLLKKKREKEIYVFMHLESRDATKYSI